MLLTLNVKTLFLKMYKINLNFKDHNSMSISPKVCIKMGRMSHSSVHNKDYVSFLGAINIPPLFSNSKGQDNGTKVHLPPPCQKGTAVGEKNKLMRSGGEDNQDQLSPKHRAEKAPEEVARLE